MMIVPADDLLDLVGDDANVGVAVVRRELRSLRRRAVAARLTQSRPERRREQHGAQRRRARRSAPARRDAARRGAEMRSLALLLKTLQLRRVDHESLRSAFSEHGDVGLASLRRAPRIPAGLGSRRRERCR